jgi:hypothetical protein
MDGGLLLNSIMAALSEVGLETVLIGNAGAAIQGAPVTTVDFDFMFRATPMNVAKLKKFADCLEAVILSPCYLASRFYRVVNDDRGLQADFAPAIHGAKSFEDIRSRAEKVQLSGRSLWVASLADIIASKRATGRPQDKAVVGILEATLRQRTAARAPRPARPPIRDGPHAASPGKASGPGKRAAALSALRKESDHALVDLIRRRLALPVEKRMNFLRVRLPGGSAL